MIDEQFSNTLATKWRFLALIAALTLNGSALWAVVGSIHGGR